MDLSVMMKKIMAVGLALSLTLAVFTGCNGREEEEDTKQVPEGEHTLLQLYQPEEGSDIAVIETSMGTIKIMLFPESAPKAVENFTKHAKDGYYNGLTFPKVIKDFMIQTGDPKGDGTGGESIWGTPFEDEFTFDLWNFRGAVTMVNSGEDSNGSQFMIIQAPAVSDEMLAEMEGAFPEDVIEQYKKKGGAPWLDHRNTVFGQVIEGMDVVDQIADVEVQTDEDGETAKYTPVNAVIIENITFEKAPAPTGEYLPEEVISGEETDSSDVSAE